MIESYRPEFKTDVSSYHSNDVVVASLGMRLPLSTTSMDLRPQPPVRLISHTYTVHGEMTNIYHSQLGDYFPGVP